MGGPCFEVNFQKAKNLQNPVIAKYPISIHKMAAKNACRFLKTLLLTFLTGPSVQLSCVERVQHASAVYSITLFKGYKAFLCIGCTVWGCTSCTVVRCVHCAGPTSPSSGVQPSVDPQTPAREQHWKQRGARGREKYNLFFSSSYFLKSRNEIFKKKNGGGLGGRGMKGAFIFFSFLKTVITKVIILGFFFVR